MLLVHWMRRAASRAAWTAGSSRAISTAMIAMTTSSSIRVNPRLGRDVMRAPRLVGETGKHDRHIGLGVGSGVRDGEGRGRPAIGHRSGTVDNLLRSQRD